MPIKPENRHRYPADWREIRAQILDRAGHCCEKCGVADHAVGWRDAAGVFHPIDYLWTSYGLGLDEDGARLSMANAQRQADFLTARERLVPTPGMRGRWFVIVLTIAHLDHMPENCEPENLRAWCQRCHNTYDAPERARRREHD